MSRHLRFLCLVLICLGHAAVAEDHDTPSLPTLLTLSEVEGRAVVRTDDGELVSVRPGDVLPGTEALLLEIQSDRLVVEVGDARAWILKPKSLSEASPVVWLRHSPPEAGTAFQPQWIPLETDAFEVGVRKVSNPTATH